MEKFFSSATAWRILLVAIIGDFLVAYALAPFYESYNHRSMVMSVLGSHNSPVRIYYNIWLVILGFLMLVSGFTIYYKYCGVSKPLSIIAVVMITVFAIGAGILAGVFSVGETKEIETLASRIHGAGAALGFMALCFVPLILSILSLSNSERLEGILFLFSFTLALLFFILFIMSDKPEYQNTVIPFEGLWQRLTLLFMYVPLAYISIRSLMDLPRGK